jgi:toxin CcdB
MARFDVHPEPGQPGRFLLNVQADILDDLAVRVGIPLMPPRVRT